MWWFVLIAQSAQAMTVDEAVDAAIASAPTAEVAQARVAEAQAVVREARGRLLPTITVSGMAAVQNPVEVDIASNLPDIPFIDTSNIDPLRVQELWMLQASAQLTQPLVVPMAWSARGAAREAEALSHVDAEAERARVARRAVDAWHAAAQAHAMLDDAHRAETLAQELLQKGEAMVDYGVAAPDEILPFRRALASAHAGVLLAEEVSVTTDGVLRVLTGSDEPAEASSIPQAPPPLDDLLDDLDRPDLRAADQRTAAAAARVGVERGAYYPTLAFVASASAMTPTPDIAQPFNWRVGLVTSIPIFQGDTVKSRVLQAAAKEGQARTAAEAQRQGATLEVMGAYGTLTCAFAELASRQEAVDLAQAAVDASVLRLDEGAGSLLQLQQAQIELVRAQTDLTRAKATAAHAADVLEVVTGGELAR